MGSKAEMSLKISLLNNLTGQGNYCKNSIQCKKLFIHIKKYNKKRIQFTGRNGDTDTKDVKISNNVRENHNK